MRNNGLEKLHLSYALRQWCGVVVAFAPMVTDDVTVYGLSLHLHPHGFRIGLGTRSLKREHHEHLQFFTLSGNPTTHRNITPEMLTSGKQGLATLGLWVINGPRGAQWIRPNTTGQRLTALQRTSSPVVGGWYCLDRWIESILRGDKALRRWHSFRTVSSW